MFIMKNKTKQQRTVWNKKKNFSVVRSTGPLPILPLICILEVTIVVLFLFSYPLFLPLRKYILTFQSEVHLIKV